MAHVLPLRIPLTYSMLASKQGWLMSPRRGVTRGQKSKGPSGGIVGGACARRPGMKTKRRICITSMARDLLNNGSKVPAFCILLALIRLNSSYLQFSLTSLSESIWNPYYFFDLVIIHRLISNSQYYVVLSIFLSFQIMYFMEVLGKS